MIDDRGNVWFTQGPEWSPLREEGMMTREEILAKMSRTPGVYTYSIPSGGEAKDPVQTGGGFWRRIWDDQPNRCGCPREPSACMLHDADGEDRLCSHCREYCRPDETFGEASP